MRPFALALSAIAIAALSGCGGKTMTEDDCKQIDAKMREVWQAESAKAAASVEVKSDKAAAVIKTEGDKLGPDWMAECKKDLVGKRVDQKEMDCLFGAKSIDEINKCSVAP